MSSITRTAILFGLLPVSACVKYPDSVTDEDVLDQLVECQSSVAVLQSDLDEISAAVADLQANDALQDGRLEDHDAEIARLDAEIAQTVLLLTNSTTVSVSDADGLLAALDELNRYRLARDVTYTIELEDGTYEFSSPLKIHHPDGGALQIIGNDASPESVVLEFADATDGIVVADGGVLGLLAGTTVRALDYSGIPAIGILVQNGASITLGAGVRVEDFYYGVYVTGNATVIGAPESQTEGWLTLTNCEFCALAIGSSYMYLPDAVATIRAGGSGFQSAMGSAAQLNRVVASGGYNGIAASLGSTVRAESAIVTGQADTGFSVGEGSYLDAASSTSTDSPYAVSVVAHGYASLSNATLDGSLFDLYQGTNGVADVSGMTEAPIIRNGDNDVDDFVVGN